MSELNKIKSTIKQTVADVIDYQSHGTARWWTWVLVGLALDLLITLSLSIVFDFSIAAAHISGYFVAAITTSLFRNIWQSKYISKPEKLRFWVIAILVLGIRGGITGSLVVWGVSEPVALVLGVTAGWFATCCIEVYYHYIDATANSRTMYWTLLTLGLVGCVIVLRICYLGILEATPQEAYYWNYSIRLAPGYLDHPPMVAVLIWIGEWLFGHSEFGLRFASYLCGLALLSFVYLFSRRLADQATALVATTLAALLPYYFFGSGLLITPDAPLAVAWIMCLYFFHRVLVGGEKRAWYGVGISLGLGMLSKYTIALLGPAALCYILLDRKSRHWFFRPEPYLAITLSVAIFSPVIFWNATHDWASFRFQTQDRFLDIPEFSLHILFENIIAIVTPLPLLVLPLLFSKQWRKERSTSDAQAQEANRNRMFVACFVLLPLAVFVWNSLTNEPRANWTGPIWLALLPTMAWTIVQAGELRWSWLSTLLRKSATPVLIGILVFYTFTLHYLTLGIPGVEYPRGIARLLGWPQAAKQLAVIQQEIIHESGKAPVIVGLDSYFMASKFSFYGTPEYLGTDCQKMPGASSTPSLRATGHHLLGDKSLMFSYWDPPAAFRGRSMILVSRSPQDLDDTRVARFFGHLSPETQPLLLVKHGFGSPDSTINQYYYRIAYDYQPPQT